MSYSYEDAGSNRPGTGRPIPLANPLPPRRVEAKRRAPGDELADAMASSSAAEVGESVKRVTPRRSARASASAVGEAAGSHAVATSIDRFDDAAASSGLSSRQEPETSTVRCPCREPRAPLGRDERIDVDISVVNWLAAATSRLPSPAAAASSVPAAAAASGIPSTVASGSGSRPAAAASTSSFAQAGPVARCSENERYARLEAARKGGLKYQPIRCGEILDPQACKRIWDRRFVPRRSFSFDILLQPGCTNYTRKMMIVPSIDCPGELADPKFCQKLLWVTGAPERPTFLFVHETEAAAYNQHVAPVLKQLGVGLVAWRDQTPGLGFGVSRLAAQVFGNRVGRREDIVMCDVNVADAKHVPHFADLNRTPALTTTGYDTDEERRERAATKTAAGRLALSSGYGTGVARLKYNLEKGTFERIEKDRAGSEDGRPLEQVVTVGEDAAYDPSFVTSSEDRDFEFQLHSCRIETKKRDFRIFKVAFTQPSRSQGAYKRARKEYLESLASSENAIRIVYSGEDTTVGELAVRFTRQYGLMPVDEMRSLIVEQILLKHKWGSWIR